MKKIKKIINIIKNNIVGFIIGVIITITISAYAATTLQSSAVYYDNSKSGGLSNTVSGAIDELYTKLNGKVLIESNFKVGDYVSMTPSSTSFTIPATLTGYDTDQTINPSELNLWRVIGINSDGTLEMVSYFISSTTITFVGVTGYANYIGVLNAIAHQYENPNYTLGSRHMGFNGQTEYILDTSYIADITRPHFFANTNNNSNEALGGGDILSSNDTAIVNKVFGTLAAKDVNLNSIREYFIASRYYNYGSNSNFTYRALTINTSGSYNTRELVRQGRPEGNLYPCRVRPIIKMKSGIKASSGNGTSALPYVLD